MAEMLRKVKQARERHRARMKTLMALPNLIKGRTDKVNAATKDAREFMRSGAATKHRKQ